MTDVLALTHSRKDNRTMAVEPHVHISPVHGLAVIALVVAVFGTAHLLALTSDSRPSRALVTLGF